MATFRGSVLLHFHMMAPILSLDHMTILCGCGMSQQVQSCSSQISILIVSILLPFHMMALRWPLAYICSRHQDILWTSTIDGWIVSLSGQNHLVWMPQGICEVIYHPYNTLIISQKGYAYINFKNSKLGTKWAECYKPVLV